MVFIGIEKIGEAGIFVGVGEDNPEFFLSIKKDFDSHSKPTGKCQEGICV